MRQVLGHILRFSVVAVLLSMANTFLADAQEAPLTISVYNRGDGNKPYKGITIYIFETKAEGKYALSVWEKDHDHIFDKEAKGTIPRNGTTINYQTEELFSTDGSILVVSLDGAFAKYVAIDDPDDVSIYMDGEAQNQIDSTVKIDVKIVTIEYKTPREKGDQITVEFACPLAPDIGRSDRRYVLQTFLTTDYTKETDKQTIINNCKEWRKVSVLDGIDYHDTQYRLMGFPTKRQMLQRDPFYVYAEKQNHWLTEEPYTFIIKDTVHKKKSAMKDGATMYVPRTLLEDYNIILDENVLEGLDLRRIYRPFQFLKYTSDPFQMDPNEDCYRQRPRSNKIPGQMELDVQFEQGSAVVDRNDPASIHNLDSLLTEIYNLTHKEGSTLRRLTVHGYSSPEGSYERNKVLADERMNTILRQITSQIPSNKVRNLHNPTAIGKVAPWEKIDSILVEEGYLNEALQLRAITTSIPNNIDAQNAQVYKLPFYDTLIKKYLKKLRRVYVKWEQEVYRPMSKEEVVEKFHENPARNDFYEYHYWLLLQTLTDPEELEYVCRRAMQRDAQNHSDIRERWLFPVNVLAASYIKRGIVDTTILAPFILRDKECDAPHKPNGEYYKLNPAPLVANQIIMLLQSKEYEEAYKLAELLKTAKSFSKDPNYELLYAIALFRSGRDDDSDLPRYSSIISNSSPINAIIIEMAEERLNDAEVDLGKMDLENPMVLYLKAQLECQRHNLNNGRKDIDFAHMSDQSQKLAKSCLLYCFQRDTSYIKTAQEDWFIFKGLYDATIKEYELHPTPTKIELIKQEKRVLSEAEQKALWNKAVYHIEDMTDEDWDMYNEYNLDQKDFR